MSGSQKRDVRRVQSTMAAHRCRPAGVLRGRHVQLALPPRRATRAPPHCGAWNSWALQKIVQGLRLDSKHTETVYVTGDRRRTQASARRTAGSPWRQRARDLFAERGFHGQAGGVVVRRAA